MSDRLATRVAERLAELDAKATKGPWGVAEEDDEKCCPGLVAPPGAKEYKGSLLTEGMGYGAFGEKADRNAVVALRNALPALAALVTAGDQCAGSIDYGDYAAEWNRALSALGAALGLDTEQGGG